MNQSQIFLVVLARGHFGLKAGINQCCSAISSRSCVNTYFERMHSWDNHYWQDCCQIVSWSRALLLQLQLGNSFPNSVMVNSCSAQFEPAWLCMLTDLHWFYDEWQVRRACPYLGWGVMTFFISSSLYSELCVLVSPVFAVSLDKKMVYLHKWLWEITLKWFSSRYMWCHRNTKEKHFDKASRHWADLISWRFINYNKTVGAKSLCDSNGTIQLMELYVRCIQLQ